jgi:hypothetical protein
MTGILLKIPRNICSPWQVKFLVNLTQTFSWDHGEEFRRKERDFKTEENIM